MTELNGVAARRSVLWGMCYDCGDKLTRFRAFVLTPTEALTGRSMIPAKHTDCARLEAQKANHVVALWIAREAPQPMMGVQNGANVAYFQLPPAAAIEWWIDERHAFRDEAILAIKAAVPALLLACNEDVNEFRDLGARVRALVPNLPTKASPTVGACISCKLETSDPAVLGCTSEECPLFPDMVEF